jgi:hypothetical protein
MGETLARSRCLAEPFSTILISYIDDGGNFLEHPGLQQGVLWGIGRVGQHWPDLVAPGVDLALTMVESDEPQVRGMALWCLGCLGAAGVRDRLTLLAADPRPVKWLRSWRVETTTVGRLATQTLAIMDRVKSSEG